MGDSSRLCHVILGFVQFCRLNSGESYMGCVWRALQAGVACLVVESDSLSALNMIRKGPDSLWSRLLT